MRMARNNEELAEALKVYHELRKISGRPENRMELDYGLDFPEGWTEEQRDAAAAKRETILKRYQQYLDRQDRRPRFVF